MKKMIAMAAMAMGLAGAAAANAGSVDFTKVSGESKANSFLFTGSDGVTVTATASSTWQSWFPGYPLVNWDGGGLGVQSDIIDLEQIDSILKTETLNLHFDSDVQIHSITFSNVDRHLLTGKDDSYTLIIDGSTAANGQIPGGQYFANDSVTGTVNFYGLGSHDTYGLQATDCINGYKVKSIEYCATASAIPLPSAAWSGLSGLGLMALIGGRKKLGGLLSA
jgi:hypothetical protein